MMSIPKNRIKFPTLRRISKNWSNVRDWIVADSMEAAKRKARQRIT